MKKLLALSVAALMLVSVATTAIPARARATEKPGKTLYKLTAIKGYKATAGKGIKYEGEVRSIWGNQDYVTLDSNVKVEGFGVKLEKVDTKNIKLIKGTLKAGTYLVGKDIMPGTYKLSGFGRAVRLSGVSLDDNNNFKGNPVDVDEKTNFIKVEKGDFALRLMDKGTDKVITAVRIKK